MVSGIKAILRDGVKEEPHDEPEFFHIELDRGPSLPSPKKEMSVEYPIVVPSLLEVKEEPQDETELIHSKSDRVPSGDEISREGNSTVASNDKLGAKLESSSLPSKTTKDLYRDGKIRRLVRVRTEELIENYICILCEFKTSSTDMLDQHYSSEHRGAVSYECTLCEVKFGLIRQHLIHQRIHLGTDLILKFRCDVCGFQCSSQITFKKHYCIDDKEFHFTVCVIAAMNQPAKFNCAHCEFKCFSKILLKRHLGSVHRDLLYSKKMLGDGKSQKGQKKFLCDICGRLYISQWDLNVHLDRHAGLKPHSCSVCDFRCLRIDSMRIHMRSHTGDKPFKCEVCDYKCVSRSTLNYHKLNHSNDKPYHCRICGSKFNRSNYLKRHMNLHDRKKFTCTLCDAKFGRADYLNKHKNIHRRQDQKQFSVIRNLEN